MNDGDGGGGRGRGGAKGKVAGGSVIRRLVLLGSRTGSDFVKTYLCSVSFKPCIFVAKVKLKKSRVRTL